MSEPRAYYNEIDSDAVAALKQLIADGVIVPGDVDSRSIKDVQPDDLAGYTQCHFFAGGGLWSVAARLAGWPDRRPLWTGSCPCQGESLAGKRLGADDPRHLWPDFFRLIRARRPAVVVGEQVAAAAGTHWLDGTAADLESEDYAARTVDIPACAVDAPHIRQRLWWLAVANRAVSGREGRPEQDGRRHDDRNLEHAASFGRREGLAESELRSGRPTAASADARNLAIADGERRKIQINAEQYFLASSDGPHDHGARSNARNGSWWADGEWIACHDGKARRAKPGIPMLVNGLVGRVAAWRLIGNAISPIVAAEVLGAYLEDEADRHFQLSLTQGVFS